MSSIRPLVTITILVVVGVVLYVKINEGTPAPTPGANEAWNEPADGVPPLAASSVAPATSDGAAPPWSPAPVGVVPSSTPPASATGDFGATTGANAASTMAAAETPQTTVSPAAATLPGVPAVPPIPEFSATAQAEPTTATAPQLSNSLPANIPEARYPDQPPVTDPASAAIATTGLAATVDAPPVTATLPAQESAATPEQMNAATAASSGISSTPAPLDANPLRPSAQVTPVDRYGASIAATTPTSIAPAAEPVTNATAETSPVEQSFVESWPGIQAMLDRGELSEAHQALSKWYGDPSLTPTDAERVETLLGQLAGTVVYSTEHRLAPAYVVKQGDTLETIAKEHNVPWQLLAKINGVAAADQVRPGQELKVVRGPFSAVVDLSRSQLILMVDDRYAGKFPVTLTPGQTVDDGEWVVGRKSSEQAPGRALLLQGTPAAPGAPAPMLVIASDALPTTAADGTVIKVAAKDAEDLSDILSIGSRVVTRR